MAPARKPRVSVTTTGGSRSPRPAVQPKAENSPGPRGGVKPPSRVIPPRHLFRTIVPPIVLPVFLAAADSTVVATALPAIAATFGEVERLSWLVIANLGGQARSPRPPMAVSRILFGRRLLMTIAMTVFMAASVLCAVAPSFEILLTARILQGLGGGGLMTLAQALIGEFVPPRQRGNYRGYLSANIVAGVEAFGPVAAGFLTGQWSWRAVFTGLSAAWPDRDRAGPTGVPKSRRQRGGGGGFDVTGLLLLTTFVLPLLMAVSQFQRSDPRMLPRGGAMARAVGDGVGRVAVAAAASLGADHGAAPAETARVLAS